ncbi:GAF and ANTAR domain-containing protein [Streptacidiphilus sp. N1-12]|uniref:GAF and ANTAR domain-containing protein n=2 Tax=Streptacidiphilus alkalitolerans TaxID=3342712 RepID=A0ABV6VI33_9ACTN
MWAERGSLAVAARLASSARALQGHAGVGETLRAIAETARELVEGSEHAGVSLLGSDGSLTSPAYTDPTVLQLDQLQAELDQGPSLEAMRGSQSQVLQIDDIAQEQRWPAFTRGAGALGIGSMLACRISTGGTPAAALNLHAGRPSAFNDEAVELAVVFAVHASLALVNAGLVESLRRSMESRQAIGEATGILMERHRVTSQKAFELLVEASQRLNVKLRDIAARVVETGQDPTSIKRPQRPPTGPIPSH